jgi:hypothetical protein
VIQADLMELSAQLGVCLSRRVFIEVPVKASPAETRDIASFYDG